MTKLYYHSECPPCLKAKVWLEEHNIAFEPRDIATDFFTTAEIEEIIGLCENGALDFISLETAEEMGIDVDENHLQADDVLKLLSEHLELLQKPIVIHNHKVHTKYDENSLSKFFDLEQV